jgi:predicted phage tail protein
MKIKFLGYLHTICEDFDFDCSNIGSVLSAIKFKYGEPIADLIFTGKYGYVLTKNNQSYGLRPEVIGTDLSEFEEIYIVPEIAGETGVEIAMIVIAVVMVVVAVVMALTMNTNREIVDDPAMTSNLFSNSPLIRDQGGIVPLVYGNPYCGGVLISSGLYTKVSAFVGAYYYSGG